ncbi:uncharacterized protein LOC109852644 isoform X2 [Pseudomyrmex gracilis]|uniref:uncharacterized protein LOC109852644 isoform X2 n=1 Tax=Pseudomyrmex gracilis TaxID=219809 RepID=UPI000995DE3E|nr:uncharacterized protein LOC109852644 isoform X2 [Pseudomyrmex gracilis]
MSVTTQIIDQKVHQLKDATFKCTQILRDQHKKIQCKTTSSKKCIIIPVLNNTVIHIEKSKLPSISTWDARTSKSKKDYCSSLKIRKKCRKKTDQQKKPSLIKFPEMRGGVLYSRCYCLHRDGLQDDCPLTQCQGQPKCLIKPWPTCPPGKFIRQRYPELY